MSVVRRNAIANYIGQGWTAFLAIAFVPLYIRYLGIESYALVGVFAILQSWMVLLDLGLTPTLTREMARYTAGATNPGAIRSILRVVERFSFAIALFTAALVVIGSGVVARRWFSPVQLDRRVIAQALAIMGLVLAFRFVESIYRGALAGLQLQVWYNVANVLLMTLRQVGALAVLAFVQPTITAFFVWQGTVSALSVIVLMVKVRSTIPRADREDSEPPQRRELLSFARGMIAITALALLLTQVDKIILSKLLPLTSFGHYTLAGSAAAVISMAVAPIAHAAYPRLVELLTQADHAGLANLYHRASQTVSQITVPMVAVLMLFPYGVVFAWSGDRALAAATAPILPWLAAGTFLNGLMWMPSQLQIASGWTSLMVKANLAAVIILVPLITIIVPAAGAAGAAAVWTLLNAGYVAFTVRAMHGRLLEGHARRWYVHDVLVPVLAGCGVAILALLVRPAATWGRLPWALFLMLVGSTAAASTFLSVKQTRKLVRWS